MSVITMTSATLSQELGKSVPDIYVVIAKHEVLGLTSEDIAKAIGLTQDEIQEVQGDETYKQVALLLKVENSRANIDREFTYDSLEAMALEKLHTKMRFENDAEFILKVAIMSNRAVRRHNTNQTLEPSSAATRVPLTLTSRLIRKLHRDGSEEQIVEKQVSLTDGTAVNPSFKDIDALLNVNARPAIPQDVATKLLTPDPSVDDLLKDMLSRD